MSDVLEYRCFIGGLSWSTSDRSLEDAFQKFGHVIEAKVVVDRDTGRSRGFGFVTFDDKKAMEEAIDRMHGMDLDGRSITVDKAQPKSAGGDRGDRSYGGGGGRGYGGGGSGFILWTRKFPAMQRSRIILWFRQCSILLVCLLPSLRRDSYTAAAHYSISLEG